MEVQEKTIKVQEGMGFL